MIRRLAFLLCLAALAPAAETAGNGLVQAVEFPYYAYPRQFWERELVWLYSIGVRTVAFSIPWNWHQPQAGEPDFTGRTSPRRDLVGFVRLLRRAGLRAWIRPLGPVPGMIDAGWPPGGARDADAQRRWLAQLASVLGTRTDRRGGPIAYVEGKAPGIDAPPPPAPVTVISATDPAALERSRRALAAGHGALLWEHVEDLLYPVGWEAGQTAVLQPGAVALGGEERVSMAVLRREAVLLLRWGATLAGMRPGPVVRPVSGRLPNGVRAAQLVGKTASLLTLENNNTSLFRDDLRVHDPLSGKTLVVPGVTVPPRQVLWLPVGVSLGIGGVCRECNLFSGEEHLVYATCELHSLEFENGILSMEFIAPVAGEVILQLARQASGPYLAAGKPTEFDWDEKTLRARLKVPAGSPPEYRVRVGLAIAPPDISAFFADAHRLLIGSANKISTSFSSSALAGRARLRLPDGFAVKPVVKSPLELDFEVTVPSDALHGSWAEVAIEADGERLGRTTLQLFRPLSVRWSEAMKLHFGTLADLPVEPPTAPADAQSGRNLEVVLRNNSMQIQTYRVEASGEGLQFFPPRVEISIGATLERSVSLRVFPSRGLSGLRSWRLRVVGGGANLDVPMRLLLVPRGQTVVWQADLDGDGADEWVLENQKARAVFATNGGGRWLEFVWKDSGVNLLPERGLLVGSGVAAVRPAGDSLEFTTAHWKRTVRLSGAALTVEQSTPLPAENVPLPAGRKDGLKLSVERASPHRATYRIE